MAKAEGARSNGSIRSAQLILRPRVIEHRIDAVTAMSPIALILEDTLGNLPPIPAEHDQYQNFDIQGTSRRPHVRLSGHRLKALGYGKPKSFKHLHGRGGGASTTSMSAARDFGARTGLYSV